MKIYLYKTQRDAKNAAYCLTEEIGGDVPNDGLFSVCNKHTCFDYISKNAQKPNWKDNILAFRVTKNNHIYALVAFLIKDTLNMDKKFKKNVQILEENNIFIDNYQPVWDDKLDSVELSTSIDSGKNIVICLEEPSKQCLLENCKKYEAYIKELRRIAKLLD